MKQIYGRTPFQRKNIFRSVDIFYSLSALGVCRFRGPPLFTTGDTGLRPQKMKDQPPTGPKFLARYEQTNHATTAEHHSRGALPGAKCKANIMLAHLAIGGGHF